MNSLFTANNSQRHNDEKCLNLPVEGKQINDHDDQCFNKNDDITKFENILMIDNSLLLTHPGTVFYIEILRNYKVKFDSLPSNQERIALCDHIVTCSPTKVYCLDTKTSYQWKKLTKKEIVDMTHESLINECLLKSSFKLSNFHRIFLHYLTEKTNTTSNNHENYPPPVQSSFLSGVNHNDFSLEPKNSNKNHYYYQQQHNQNFLMGDFQYDYFVRGNNDDGKKSATHFKNVLLIGGNNYSFSLLLTHPGTVLFVEMLREIQLKFDDFSEDQRMALCNEFARCLHKCTSTLFYRLDANYQWVQLSHKEIIHLTYNSLRSKVLLRSNFEIVNFHSTLLQYMQTATKTAGIPQYNSKRSYIQPENNQSFLSQKEESLRLENIFLHDNNNQDNRCNNTSNLSPQFYFSMDTKPAAIGNDNNIGSSANLSSVILESFGDYSMLWGSISLSDDDNGNVKKNIIENNNSIRSVLSGSGDMSSFFGSGDISTLWMDDI